MPYELLKQLCVTELPEKIGDPSEIDKLKVLRAEGLIEVDIPYAQPERGRQCYCGNAIVMRVTPTGRAAASKQTRILPCDGVVKTTRHRSVPSPFL